MRILAIDVGTGTQDILLFDSAREPENCFKMVLPAPTQIVAARIRRATDERRSLVLGGRLMGGGPLGWAVQDHLKAGLSVYAEERAARTLDDDLASVQIMGVQLLGDGEEGPHDATRLELRDLDLPAIETALGAFGLPAAWDGLAVAVLDHGNAPSGISDRVFRFDHIRRVAGSLQRQTSADAARPFLSFAYTPDNLPPYLTRMASVAASVADCAPTGLPLTLMDTGPAAGLGALLDLNVAKHHNLVLVNVGNMHTLATWVSGGRLAGLFEHHTGRLTPERLSDLVGSLTAGTLTHEQVFEDHGHGCLQVPVPRWPGRPFVSVTGPRRALLSARLRPPVFAAGSPYYAVPHGDMMIAGCWGLVRAFAHTHPNSASEILAALEARRSA